MIRNIQGIAQSKLAHVVDTDDCVGFRFCRAQRREKEARENGNDRDDDKQFDERECSFDGVGPAAFSTNLPCGSNFEQTENKWL
jgi:hypothetical protein